MEQRKLFEEAHRRYWDELESRRPLGWIPLSYEMVNEVRKGKWPPFIDMMVSDELQETINLINAWRGQLLDWSVWATVLPTFDEHDRLTIQMQQGDPLAFACMFQASAMRDRFCMIASNATHQANLVAVSGYKDWLEQDDLPPGRFLSRSKKEKQLERLGSGWTTFGELQKQLQSINTANYRQATRNFRNHVVIPSRHDWRWAIRTPSRDTGRHSNNGSQPDGSFKLVADPKRMVVAYGFGGASPLKNEEMVTATQEQHGVAVAALAAYEALLCEILGAIGTN